MSIDVARERAELDKLCAWLRENSSGVYRPAADAATVIEGLIAQVDDLTLRVAQQPSIDEAAASDTIPVPDAPHACRRCNSYAMLVKSLEARIVSQSETAKAHAEAMKGYEEARATLESERAANAILTEENERLRAQATGQAARTPPEGEKGGMSHTSGGDLAPPTKAAVRAVLALPSIVWWHPDGHPVFNNQNGDDLILRKDAVAAIKCTPAETQDSVLRTAYVVPDAVGALDREVVEGVGTILFKERREGRVPVYFGCLPDSKSAMPPLPDADVCVRGPFAPATAYSEGTLRKAQRDARDLGYALGRGAAVRDYVDGLKS